MEPGAEEDCCNSADEAPQRKVISKLISIITCILSGSIFIMLAKTSNANNHSIPKVAIELIIPNYFI